MKKTLSLCFVFLFSKALVAQNEAMHTLDSIFPVSNEFYEAAADTCIAPSIALVAPIHYNGYSRYYLEFAGLNPFQTHLLKYKKQGETGLGIMGTREPVEEQQPTAVYPTAITVWDVTGKLVASLEADELNVSANISLLIAQRFGHLPSGIYWVRSTQNGRADTKKIVIQN